MFLQYNELNINTIIVFVLLISSFFSLYECGYLYNDAKATLKESNPNFRVDHKFINFIRSKFYTILLIKILIASSLLTILHVYFTINAIEYLPIWCFCMLLFYIHNKVRSNWNILTYSGLCYLKYISILPLIGIDYLYVFLVFPILRSFEHSTKSKYAIYSYDLVPKLDQIRFIYYLIMFITFYCFFDTNLIVVIGYYFIIRTLFFMLLKSNFSIRRD